MVLRLTQSLIWKIQEYDDIWQYDMTCGKIITTGCIQDDIVSIIYILGDIVSMWMVFSIFYSMILLFIPRLSYLLSGWYVFNPYDMWHPNSWMITWDS